VQRVVKVRDVGSPAIDSERIGGQVVGADGKEVSFQRERIGG
jgi:hypothetical protein